MQTNVSGRFYIHSWLTVGVVMTWLKAMAKTRRRMVFKVKRNDFITNNIKLGNWQHNQILTELTNKLTKPQHNGAEESRAQ